MLGLDKGRLELGCCLLGSTVYTGGRGMLVGAEWEELKNGGGGNVY